MPRTRPTDRQPHRRAGTRRRPAPARVAALSGRWLRSERAVQAVEARAADAPRADPLAAPGRLPAERPMAVPGRLPAERPMAVPGPVPAPGLQPAECRLPAPDPLQVDGRVQADARVPPGGPAPPGQRRPGRPARRLSPRLPPPLANRQCPASRTCRALDRRPREYQQTPSSTDVSAPVSGRSPRHRPSGPPHRPPGPRRRFQ